MLISMLNPCVQSPQLREQTGWASRVGQAHVEDVQVNVTVFSGARAGGHSDRNVQTLSGCLRQRENCPQGHWEACLEAPEGGMPLGLGNPLASNGQSGGCGKSPYNSGGS